MTIIWKKKYKCCSCNTKSPTRCWFIPMHDFTKAEQIFHEGFKTCQLLKELKWGSMLLMLICSQATTLLHKYIPPINNQMSFVCLGIIPFQLIPTGKPGFNRAAPKDLTDTVTLGTFLRFLLYRTSESLEPPV